MHENSTGCYSYERRPSSFRQNAGILAACADGRTTRTATTTATTTTTGRAQMLTSSPDRIPRHAVTLTGVCALPARELSLRVRHQHII